MKQLGNLEYFSGIEVPLQYNVSLFPSQTKYIKDLLTKVKIVGAKGMHTPMISSLNLSKHRTYFLSNPIFYKSIVGALHYATITRPKINYVVNKAYRFLAQTLTSHWIAIKNYEVFKRVTSSWSPIAIKAFSNVG